MSTSVFHLLGLKTRASSVSPYFLSHFTSSQASRPVSSTVTICLETDHFSLPHIYLSSPDRPHLFPALSWVPFLLLALLCQLSSSPCTSWSDSLKNIKSSSFESPSVIFHLICCRTQNTTRRASWPPDLSGSCPLFPLQGSHNSLFIWNMSRTHCSASCICLGHSCCRDPHDSFFYISAQTLSYKKVFPGLDKMLPSPESRVFLCVCLLCLLWIPITCHQVDIQ